MASEDIKEALKEAAIRIRDEKQAGANTAMRVGSLLLAICEALSLTPDELEKIFLRKDQSDTAAGFFLLRIFKPYRRMTIQYPVLKKCPVLLPVFWIWRWATLLLNRRKIRRTVRELALNKKLDGEAVSAAKRLFLDLELYWKRI